jgi:hypothetical protein
MDSGGYRARLQSDRMWEERSGRRHASACATVPFRALSHDCSLGARLAVKRHLQSPDEL